MLFSRQQEEAFRSWDLSVVAVSTSNDIRRVFTVRTRSFLWHFAPDYCDFRRARPTWRSAITLQTKSDFRKLTKHIRERRCSQSNFVHLTLHHIMVSSIPCEKSRGSVEITSKSPCRSKFLVSYRQIRTARTENKSLERNVVLSLLFFAVRIPISS